MRWDFQSVHLYDNTIPMRDLLYCFICTVFLFFPEKIYAQEFVWAHEQYNPTFTDVAAGQNGYSYTTGLFNSTLDLGDTTLNASGKANFYVAKHDAEGRLVQAWQGISDSKILNVKVRSDDNNNIYVAVQFEGELTFGNISNTYRGHSYSHTLIKIDTNGNIAWHKFFNNTHPNIYRNITILDVATGHNNDLYISGTVDSLYPIDSINFDPAKGNLYLARLSSTDGKVIWVQNAGYPGFYKRYYNYHTQLPIAVDNNNDVFIAGEMRLHLTFHGNDTLDGNNVGGFLAKYDENGNYLWSTNVSNGQCERVDLMTCDGNNVLLSGVEAGISPKKYYLTNYTSNGQQQWLNFNSSEIFTTTGNSNGLYCGFHFKDTFYYQGINITRKGWHSAIIKLDPGNASPMWKTEIVLKQATNFPLKGQIAATDEGGILFAGYAPSIILAGQSSIGLDNYLSTFLTLIHDTTIVPAAYNTIEGSIFSDTNLNCINGNEPGLKGFGIIAEPGPYYAVTDTAGHYALKVGSGTYNIKAIAPGK